VNKAARFAGRALLVVAVCCVGDFLYQGCRRQPVRLPSSVEIVGLYMEGNPIPNRMTSLPLNNGQIAVSVLIKPDMSNSDNLRAFCEKYPPDFALVKSGAKPVSISPTSTTLSSEWGHYLALVFRTADPSAAILVPGATYRLRNLASAGTGEPRWVIGSDVALDVPKE